MTLGVWLKLMNLLDLEAKSRMNVVFPIRRMPHLIWMNQEASLTAYEVVNHYDYHDLVRIFSNMEKTSFPNRLLENWTGAWALNRSRLTTELAEIIKSAKPAKEPRKVTQPNKFSKPFVWGQWWVGRCRWVHPTSYGITSSGWENSVITFHSLEDRFVSNSYLRKLPQLKF